MHKITTTIATLILLILLTLGWKAKDEPTSGITQSCISTHIYNDCSAAGYITLGFAPITGAGTSAADPLTIQQSNQSMGVFVNNPQARVHIKGSGATTASSALLVNNSADTELFRVLDNGNIGIGINNPQSKLAVNGTITTKKVTLTPNGWSDYVFADDYKLPDLKEVAQFIATHKHLPGVPSEAEVMKNGIELGENQTLLLKKIEELTLYAIQQQKEIDLLKEIVNKLTTRN